jgi:putative transposase
MSKIRNNFNRTIHSWQVLEAFVRTLRSKLPLELQGTRITKRDMLYVLGYASVHRLSPGAACAELDEAPSGNRFREVLTAALPQRAHLQRQLNTILRGQLPPSVLKGKRGYALAIDMTLIPYHGQPYRDKNEVARGVAKSGTTHFHAYATVCIVHNKRRYVLALMFVELHETMLNVVHRLLNRVKRLKIKVKRVFLDRAFSSIGVFRTLDRRRLSYIVPLVVRGRSGGVRRLFHGRASYFTSYTLASQQHGRYTIQSAVVRRYTKGKYGRHGVQWFAYAISGLATGTTPAQVFQLYRQRFGIETSYRQMNQVRARTASRNPAIRLLLIGLSFILVNLYVTLREQLMTRPRAAVTSTRPWLTLHRLALMLGRAIENLFGISEIVQHRHSTVLS